MSDPIASTAASAISELLLSGPKDDSGKDESIFSKIKEAFSDISVSMKNKDMAFDVFEKNFLFLKGFFLVFFIILAVVNYMSYKNVGLISTKPGLFAAESAVFGLSGVVPFLMICYLRNQVYTTQQIVYISIALFIAFFILNYLLELSGVYAATFYPKTEKELAAERQEALINGDLSYTSKLTSSVNKTSDIIIAGFIVGSLAALLFSAFCVKDFSPVYSKFGNITSNGTLAIFLTEMLLFGIISAVPIFFMASNRDELSKNTAKEFGLIVVKFVILHCVLQVSGFYRHMFNKNKIV